MNFSQLTEQQVDALAKSDPQLLKELYSEHQSNSLEHKRNMNQVVNDDGSRHIQVADSMHPEIGAWDRFVAKNFASNPEAQMGYMKKKYPNLEFDKLRNGELVARNKDEVDWKRLDEKGTSVMDFTDIAADVGQGTAEAVGGVAAGIATANPLVGMGTAGGIGWATEGMKQGIGSMLGVPNNSDSDNRALSGAASMALPVIGKYAVKPAWGMAKKAAPYVGEFVSGIPREVLSNIHTDKIARDGIKNTKNGVKKFASDLADKVHNGMYGALDKAGVDVGNTTQGNLVDISQLKQQMNTAMSSLTPEQQKGWGYLKDKISGYPDQVGHKQATELKNYYYQLGAGDESVLGKGALDAAANTISKGERKLAQQYSTGVRASIKDAAPDKGAFEKAYEKYSNVADTLTDDKIKPFNSTDKTVDFLDRFGSTKSDNKVSFRDDFFNEVKETIGKDADGKYVDIPLAAREYQSANYFNNPSKMPKTWGNAGKGGAIGSGMGGAIAYGTGMGAGPGIALTTIGGIAGAAASSPWSMMKAANTGKNIDTAGKYVKDKIYLNPYFRSDKGLINVMSNENER